MKKLMTILIALSLVVFLGCSKEQADEMAANAKEKAGETADAAKKAGYDAAESAKDAVEEAGDNAKELAEDAVDGAKNAANDAIEGTKEAAEKTMQDAKAAAENVAGVIPAGSHEVGCGKCMYNMAGVAGCVAAVKVDGKPMLISGNTVDCHQYGLCSGTKMAEVEGKVVGDQFAATKVTIN